MVYFAKWKVILVLVVCVFGVAFVMPNFVDARKAEALPSWLPHLQVSLGLDLQGGSHLLLEVDSATVIRERLETLIESVRETLRGAGVHYTGLGAAGNAVAVTIKDAGRAEEARVLLRKLDAETTTELGDGGRITLTLTELAVRERKSSAVDQSIEIVRRRIDETGVR